MSDFSITDWRIERRREPQPSARLIGLSVALVGAVLVCSLLFIAAGASPWDAF